MRWVGGDAGRIQGKSFLLIASAVIKFSSSVLTSNPLVLRWRFLWLAFKNVLYFPNGAYFREIVNTQYKIYFQLPA